MTTDAVFCRRDRLRGLYLITPDRADTSSLLSDLSGLLAVRPALLQYRNKLAGDELKHEQAVAILRLCRAAGVPLIINDDVDLALRIGADGVHIGGDDGEPEVVRRQLGPDRLLGVSCYAGLEHARRAHAAGADYIAFGAVRPSSTKPLAVSAPLSLFRDAAGLGLPMVGIGGLTLENAEPVIAAGADMLAVISDIFDAPDPVGRAQAYTQLFA